MFIILGTFGIVFLMLIIGFIGETISGMFSPATESDYSVSGESYSELATAS
jgi:hypothetical protein